MTQAYPAPAESDSFRALIDLIEEAAGKGELCDADVLREILWLTVAHSELLAMSVAVKRLIDIFERFPQGWHEAVTEARVLHWRPTLDWLITHEKTITARLGKHYAHQRNTNGNNPVRGNGSTEFPFYAVLCELLPAGPNGERFLMLSAHLLLAHVIAMREHSLRPDYEVHGAARDWRFLPNQPDGACRAVRRLTEPRGEPILAALTVELEPEEFAAQLKHEPMPAESELAQDRIHLYRFLQKAWGLLDWRESEGGKGKGGGHRWVGGRLEGRRLSFEPYLAGTDTDLWGTWGRIDLVKLDAVSSRKKNQSVAADLAPDESESDEEILLSDFDCEETRQDPGTLARAARAKARHVERANQLFSWAYERLAMSEIGQLILALRAECDRLIDKSEWSAMDRVDAQCVLAIITLLMTGSSVERAAHLRLIDRAGEHDVELGLRTDGMRPAGGLHWQIRVLEPEYRSEWPENSAQCRPRAKHVTYPDLFGVGPLVERVLPSRVRILRNRSPYELDEETIAEKVRGWLRRRFPNGRLTPEKVGHFLWARVHELTGDAALASCVTGLPHLLSRVRLHYTSPALWRLERLYGEAFAPFFPNAYHGDPREDTAVTVAAGARLCPTVASVRNMFARLREDIEDSRCYVERGGFARHHNLLTLYTVLFFGYGTSCRAIVTPYLSLDEIDAQRGIASLSDKDDESRHKTRLVWLPPVLIRQIRRYESHLAALKWQLPDLPTTLRQEPCFFLDADGVTPQLVRPKTLEPLLRRYLDVRANTHRRFLRTELIERGCPA